jgi:hypothetical protein
MRYDVSLQTIAWLRGRRADASLQISPKFQRRPVWLEPERSELISTILLRLPFPEVYIQSVLDNATGQEQNIVVDGQQRITSILMFIDNEVPLPTNDYWQGQYFRDLDEDQKQIFWNYKIVVRGLSETNDAEIRDLFVRLNTNNVSLNDQELRNSKYKGRFKQAAERFADNPLFQELGLFTARDIRRMLDVEFASELLLLLVEGITNKKDFIEEAYARFELEFPDETRYDYEFNAAISLVRTLASTENATTIKTKSNFFSIFGACVQFLRTTGKASFVNGAAIQVSLTELLDAARSGNLDGKPKEFHEYADSVTRAASDRGRRARRQEIIYHLIATAEGLTR